MIDADRFPRNFSASVGHSDTLERFLGDSQIPRLPKPHQRFPINDPACGCDWNLPGILPRLDGAIAPTLLEPEARRAILHRKPNDTTRGNVERIEASKKKRLRQPFK